MHPMISSLLRHRLSGLLLILQVALAVTVIANAVTLAGPWLRPLLGSDGIRDADAVLLVSGLQQARGIDAGHVEATRAAIAALPGVQAVSVGNLPYLESFFLTGQAGAEQTAGAGGGAAAVEASIWLQQDLVSVFGLQLLHGRDFESAERSRFGFGDISARRLPAGSCLLSRALAERLFGSADRALGQVVSLSLAGQDLHPVVVGVVATLGVPDPLAADGGAGSLVLPIELVDAPMAAFALRVSPSALDAVRAALPALIERELGLDEPADPQILSVTEARSRYYGPTRALLWLMAMLVGVVVGVTVMGMSGLTGLWVAQRRQQIGIRRALGARRKDILRGFHGEILVLSGLGILPGLAAAWALNHGLVTQLAVQPLSPTVAALAVLLALVVAQLAARWPALQAARIEPLEATRPA